MNRRAIRAVRFECRAHRQALVALVDPGLADAAAPFLIDPAARAHLESCDRCRVEVEGQRLVAHRLRRDVAAAKDFQPGQEAWPALQRRIARRPAPTPPAARASLGGLLGATLAAALLIAVAAPGRIGTIDEPGFDPRWIAEQGRRDAADEARWLRSNAQVRVPARVEIVVPHERFAAFDRYGESVPAATGNAPVNAPSGGYRVH